MKNKTWKERGLYPCSNCNKPWITENSICGRCRRVKDDYKRKQ